MQMFFIAGMALAIGRGGAEDTTRFVLSYVGFRVVLILLNLRVVRHVPASRPLLARYLTFYVVEAAFWSLSLLVEPPLRYWLWAIGTAGTVLMPLTARRAQSRARVDAGHIVERFGLFTIIVLGESVLAVVSGAVAQERVAPAAIAAGGLAFVAAFCFWWIYFDNVDERVVARFTDEPAPRAALTALAWTYIHLPLTASLTAFGVGVGRLVAHDPGSPLGGANRWLLCGAAALALFSLGVIHLDSEGRSAQRQAGAHVAGAVLLLALAALGGGLPPLALIGAIAAVAVMQVVVDTALSHE